jgi:cytochrome c5
MNALRFSSTILAGAIGALVIAAASGRSAPAAQKVVTIVLPAQNVAFRDATGVEVARKDCLVCHSAEYVTQQPALSKAAWNNEITKMRAAYGAPIPDADTDALVAYLVAQNPVTKK